MTFITLDQLVRLGFRGPAEAGELRAAVSLLALRSARLTWSNYLARAVAYVPDAVLRAAPGAVILSLRTAFGSDVLVVPESLRLP